VEGSGKFTMRTKRVKCREESEKLGDKVGKPFAYIVKKDGEKKRIPISRRNGRGGDFNHISGGVSRIELNSSQRKDGGGGRRVSRPNCGRLRRE